MRTARALARAAALGAAALGVASGAVALGAAASGCDGGASADGSGGAGAGAGGGSGGYLPYEGVAFPNKRPKVEVPGAGLGIVVNAGADTLTAVDVGAGSVVTTLPVGRDPVTPDGPVGVAVHGPTASAYVLLGYADLHADLHAKGGGHVTPSYVQKLTLGDLSIVGEVELPEEPRGLTLSDDGARLVTAHWSSPGEAAAQMTPDALEAARGRVSVIDTSAIETVFSETPPSVTACIGARAVALSRPDGARAFVACFDEDMIAVVDVDAATGELTVERVPAGPLHGLPGLPVHGPTALSVSADGQTLFFANELPREIRVMDVQIAKVDEGEVVTTPGVPVAVEAGIAGSVHVLTKEPAAVLRWSSGLEGAPLAEQALPAECAVPVGLSASAGGALLVVCAGAEAEAAGRVLVLDGQTLEVKGSVSTGPDPRAAAVVPGGAR